VLAGRRIAVVLGCHDALRARLIARCASQAGSLLPFEDL